MTEILGGVHHLWLKYALCFLHLQVDQIKGHILHMRPRHKELVFIQPPKRVFLNLNRWTVLNISAMKMVVLNLIIHKTSRGRFVKIALACEVNIYVNL